jgi:hypothetical protein
MTNAKSAPTPLPSNWVPQPNKGKASPELLRQYQSIIGLLLYLMIGTRPDIAFAVTHFRSILNEQSIFANTLLVPRTTLLCSNMHQGKDLLHTQTRIGHLTPLQGGQSLAISSNQLVVPLHGDPELRLLLLTPRQRQNIWHYLIAPVR